MSKNIPINEKLSLMKSWALKSGYPLENDIARILATFPEAKVTRDMAFEAKNQDGENAIRSIDFKCSFELPTKTIPVASWPRGPKEKAILTFLIDAKFSEDETFWFTPDCSSKDLSFPRLIPMLTKEDSVGTDLQIHRREFVELSRIPSDWRVASSGRKVKEQTKERNSLADYQIQMIGGLQSVIEEESQSLGTPDKLTSEYARNVHFYFPLVASNAPIFILKQGVVTDEVNTAESEDALAEIVDHVALIQPHLFHVKEALSKLSIGIKHLRTNSLAWLPQDLTVFPVVFVGVTALKNTIRSILKRFKDTVTIAPV